MALNAFNVMPPGWQELQSKNWCGPDELAHCVIHFRRVNMQRFGPRWNAPISDEGIRNLVSLAYHASLIPEEGRFPRCRLLCGFGTDDIGGASAVCFEQPVALDGAEGLLALRRLAPIGADDDTALLVTERPGERGLLALGLAIRRELEPHPASPTGLFGIAIEGPANLLAVHTGMPVAYQLVQGEVRQTVRYDAVPQVRAFFEELEATLLQRAIDQTRLTSRELFGADLTLADVLRRTFSQVLKSTIEQRRGGCFLVVPCYDDQCRRLVRCRYSTSFDLARDILEFVLAGRHDAALQVRPRAAALLDLPARREPEWFRKRENLLRGIRALSMLANVDGCVVLDRRMVVRGFGGEIQMHEGAPQMPLTDYFSGQPRGNDELQQYGTRHRSACRFCQQQPKSLAFVISQDGELRVFCSDDEHAFGFERLDACPGIEL